MKMANKTDSVEAYKELAAQKEKEWREVTDLRIQTLEAAIKEKDTLYHEEKSKLNKLKEDFKYNFKLLEERDQELEQYDASFKGLKAQLNVKNAEISELKIKLDDMKSCMNREASARDDLQRHYQNRLKEKQAEIDSYKCEKDLESQEARKEFERFEDALKRREHEFRIQADEMSAKVLEYELKAKLLAKELEIMKCTNKKTTTECKYIEDNQKETDKKLKEKEWELADMQAMKNARIAELENQIQQLENSMKRMQEDFQRKHAEMDKYGREKESALANVKEGYAEREQSLHNTIRELQSKMEEQQIDIRQLQWTKDDIEKDKNLQIEKLHDEINQMKQKWDKHLVDMSKNQVSKDVELETLRENEERIKSELLQKKEDIERYKKELGLAVERESNLERSKAQLELDWQRRFENIERNQYEKSEELIKKLTRARDEALATVKERNREIQQRDQLIRVLHRDKEQAMVTLKKHDIPLDKNINIDLEKSWSFTDPEELKKLREQNENLMTVIKEMRLQMEEIGQELPAPDEDKKSTKDGTNNNDYINSLETDNRKLKQEVRKLQSELESGRQHGRVPMMQPTTSEQEVMSEIKDNTMVKRHIQSLNDVIGSLRAEKVELTAQVKKQQAKLQYQEKMLDQVSQQPRQKQVEIDQLQYEVGAQSRRYQAEIASLQQRIKDLELQLLEARKEADEYYKGNLERNMEVTALGQELSNMKLELAEKRPALNFGAQELVIQQLQDEIMRLKQAGHVTESEPIRKSKGFDSNTNVENLQQKLKSAAKHIAQLAKERQQLIEICNRLRADLKKAGVTPTSPKAARKPMFTEMPSSQPEMTSSQPLSQQFLGKLSQLENLQYELTKQQLQYAQKYPELKKSGTVESVKSEVEEEYRPPSILKRSTEFNGTLNDTQETQRSSRSMNTNMEQSLPHNSQEYKDQLLMSMSSVGGESLQEIWKMLDERPSPSPYVTPRYPDDMQNSKSSEFQDSSSNLVISGQKPKFGQRKKSPNRMSERTIGKQVKKTTPKMSGVRNYNYRDDIDNR
ncbi:hypothetical protein KUTeg_004532 [Tegillarca granosa]|uniref:Coiled-coil domain-containing protein 57 n=1 Tax=Tegillarca granosa TaxID=220873 RepID=A0ABQ9FRS3_TEGGR|nr:hypothetical protein KUTeg_004532 [Tegillarca granosa]